MTFVACCIAMVLLEFSFPDDWEQLVYQSMFAGVMVSTVFWYFRLDLTRPDGALQGMEPKSRNLRTGIDRLDRHVMPTIRKYHLVEFLALLAAISAILKD